MSTFELDALKQHPDEGPVAMVNLLKFRAQSLDGDGTGLDAYLRYGAVARGIVESRGGSIKWIGTVDHPALHEGGDVNWDMVQLVTYPNRASFIEMVTRPEYLEANVHRTNGVEKHVILATKTMSI